tara:strand:+ start:1032 stop:1553 length:522 start_codon:yes stop_codon:yes gene_type:complete
MKKLIILMFISTSFLSCSNISEREKKINSTEEIVLKVYNAQLSGDIETLKSLVSDDFTMTLTGKLDISKTYDWNSFMDFNKYFGSLLIGEVGGEFTDIISGENAAVVFLNGKMEGIGGKYENDYAIRYSVNSEGKVNNIKEWLSDIHLATQLYGEDISGEHKDPDKRYEIVKE